MKKRTKFPYRRKIIKRQSMKQIKIFFLSLFISLFYTDHVMAIEEPKYEIIQIDGAFEIRKYTSMLIAETFTDGDMDEASNKGFRLIADFIFGNNQAVDSNTNSKIAMTAPVTVEYQNSESSMLSAKKWRIHFVMPSQFTIANIPKPKSDAISLREVPSKFYLVHSYSGFNTIARVQSKTDETMQWAQRKSLKVIGTPQLSRYDPPWTLPMFRRNEIMVEINWP
ncbi:MAG: heme-binding protein [Chitinophagia bacterium]|nr:heme-binding protein [Chitinophagia bacterium]